MKKLSTTKLVEKIEFLNTFRKIDSQMPVSQIIFLLAVAREPEKSVKQIADATGIAYASAARYMQLLSRGRPAMGQEGLGFINAEENPFDRKEKLLTLTEEGMELLSEIV